MNIIRGLTTVLKQSFEPKVTIQYPEQERPVRERFKGRHALKRYDNGLEKCIGCALCAAACPADAIWVEASENTDEQRFSPGERYAKTYEINMLRCIFCGYCEDACPTEAIVLEHDYRLSFQDRRDAIYTKDMLIDPPAPGAPETPQQTEPGKFTRAIPDMEDPL
ncbi:MAG TPA: NADH-quinone oxidoreductase subunit NuoI [Aggregatilinea sp.]|uniref:NADH-quinone oxidoreductase subunit NuoI n=1 Tax=Aggregatilinea sp. TaxID=2806333 RepID=UPI002C049CAF|nr:NADH-quinone oxidoreductase subunit NuoI [Aggregatilinea sp.]HML20007.1 NADH-quinone oxidoreductase subunit NuoI [Aggregatilinea sp.]